MRSVEEEAKVVRLEVKGGTEYMGVGMGRWGGLGDCKEGAVRCLESCWR